MATEEGSELNTEKVVQEIVNSSNSLESQLGKDWKKRSIFNSVNDVFTPEEIEMIKNKKLPVLNSTSTDTEKWAIEANNVFENNLPSYHASVVENSSGEQKVLVEGSIDLDRFYVIAPFSVIQKQTDGRTIMGFGGEKAGFITQEGKVFSINGLMEERGKETDILFMTSSGKKPRVNMEVSSNISNDVICTLPENSEGIGTMSHELGHAIRARKRKDSPEQEVIHHEAHDKFERIIDEGELVPEIPRGLNPEQVRHIKTNEERGAWATGISLIREVGKEIDLEASSTENIERIIVRSEVALRTYDEVPYNLAAHESIDELIPSFSREMRKAAKELREKMQKHNLDYSNFPNFDETTGQAIRSNPKRLINEAEKLTKE